MRVFFSLFADLVVCVCSFVWLCAFVCYMFSRVFDFVQLFFVGRWVRSLHGWLARGLVLRWVWFGLVCCCCCVLCGVAFSVCVCSCAGLL